MFSERFPSTKNRRSASVVFPEHMRPSNTISRAPARHSVASQRANALRSLEEEIRITLCVAGNGCISSLNDARTGLNHFLDDCPGVPNSRWPWGSVALPACGRACARFRPDGVGQRETVVGGHDTHRRKRPRPEGHFPTRAFKLAEQIKLGPFTLRWWEKVLLCFSHITFRPIYRLVALTRSWDLFVCHGCSMSVLPQSPPKRTM